MGDGDGERVGGVGGGGGGGEAPDGRHHPSHAPLLRGSAAGVTGAEIEAAGLSPDEEEPLLARYRVASNSRRLVELAGGIVSALEEGETAALPALAEAQKLWRELAALDPSMADAARAQAEAVAALEDAARDARRYRDRLDPDPELLRRIEERMDAIESLKRKYGGSVEAVIAFGENAAERLRKITSRGEELGRLAAEIARLERFLWVLATVANIAPLFGFLGTVTGMIQSFDQLAAGRSEPQDLAGGIGQAMLTTAGGLIVGIPAMFCYFFFRNKLLLAVNNIQKAATFLIDVISGELKLSEAAVERGEVAGR